MLKIRLSRIGKKNQPSFRVIVQEHTAAVKGQFIEEMGYYKPAQIPKVFKGNLERIKYWLSVGAKPSDAMAVLLKKEGVGGMDKFIEPRDKKRKKKVAKTETQAGAEGTVKPAQAKKSEPVAAPKGQPQAEEPKKEPGPAKKETAPELAKKEQAQAVSKQEPKPEAAKKAPAVPKQEPKPESAKKEEAPEPPKAEPKS